MEKRREKYRSDKEDSCINEVKQTETDTPFGCKSLYIQNENWDFV